MEAGLSGEFSEDDIRNLVKDHHEHGEPNKFFRYPGRVATNYVPSDDLSIYKTHPVGSGPKC